MELWERCVKNKYVEKKNDNQNYKPAQLPHALLSLLLVLMRPLMICGEQVALLSINQHVAYQPPPGEKWSQRLPSKD